MSVFRFPCSHDTILTQTTTFGYLNPPSKASGIVVSSFQNLSSEKLNFHRKANIPVSEFHF